MKAIVFTGYGVPEKVMELKDDIPVPSGYDTKDQVLVKVHAAAINPFDKLVMNGDMDLVTPIEGFPHVLSYDAAGVVSVADSSGKWKVGDEVMFRLFAPSGEPNGTKTPYFRGAMAEYCVTSAEFCAKKPNNISFAEAASAPLAGLTALQCLRIAGTKEGSRVFISGGAGGVGSLAIQLAKNIFKASHVVTTASAGEKTDLCKSLGADEVIDYKSQKFEEIYSNNGSLLKEQFDVCLDCTGESLKMVQVTKKGGRIICIFGMPTLEEIRAIGGESCILGLVIAKREARAEYKAALAAGIDWNYNFLKPSNAEIVELAKYMENGDVKAVIDNVWAAESATWRGAFDRLFSGRAKGKCVVQFVKD